MKVKKLIGHNAESHGLSVSEYLRQRAENGTKRIIEIDRLIEKVSGQNAGGIPSYERFAKMLQSCEKEQRALSQEEKENRQTLQNAEQRVVDLRLVPHTSGNDPH